MNINLLISFGTRPEYIKILPLLKEFKGKINYKVLFTGQHKDLIGYDIRVDHTHSIKSNDLNNRLNDVISSCLDIPREVFKDITHVLVQGDTASALGIALNAYNRGLKVIHLEAGLRTHDLDNPWPEESYRQMISRISSINLCPTQNNYKNLTCESVFGKIYITGNTVLDNLVDMKPTYNNEVLITMHRRENHTFIREWFTEISKLAREHTDILFTLPLHPNPNVSMHKNILEGVNVINPLPYDVFINRLKDCKFLISDSGGIQEEAAFLGKKVIVCRKTTERTEGIGKCCVLCPTPDKLKGFFYKVNKDYKSKKYTIYGDGESSKKILKVLLYGK